MTASSVQVTQGSGTRMATNSYIEGAVTVHDEKVILGEQYLASYILSPLADPSIATGSSHVLELMAGASLKVRVRRIEIFQSVVATAAVLTQFTLWRLSTAGTGGIAYTPRPLETTDPAAGATGMGLPTVKGTESVQVWYGTAYFMQTVAASDQLTEPLLVMDFDRPRTKPLIIPAGTSNGIAIKNQGSIAGALVEINIWFDESSF